MPQGVFIGFPEWVYWLVLLAVPAGISALILYHKFRVINSNRSATRTLHLSRAALRAKEGDIKGALQDYGKAIEVDPESPDPYVRRAMLFQANGDHAAALRDYEAALEVAPPTWPYRAKSEAALETLRSSISSEPRPERKYLEIARTQKLILLLIILVWFGGFGVYGALQEDVSGRMKILFQWLMVGWFLAGPIVCFILIQKSAAPKPVALEGNPSSDHGKETTGKDN